MTSIVKTFSKGQVVVVCTKCGTQTKHSTSKGWAITYRTTSWDKYFNPERSVVLYGETLEEAKRLLPKGSKIVRAKEAGHVTDVTCEGCGERIEVGKKKVRVQSTVRDAVMNPAVSQLGDVGVALLRAVKAQEISS
jgi:hypothetical protein